jgi:RNA polymerase sigma factor (sigma-70 family)
VDQDSALLLQARRDPQAFGSFFARNCDGVLAHLYRLTMSPDVAADLMAETFARALLGVGRFDPGLGNARMWLFGIARNQYLAWVRSGAVEQRARQRLRMRPIQPDDESLARIEALVDAQALRHDLLHALGALSPMDRLAVELRVVRECSFEVVAAELGCSEGAARVRVSRALASLRRAWPGPLPTPSVAELAEPADGLAR